MWNVGDLFCINNIFYEVSGNYSGGVGCVNLVGLTPMTQRSGVADIMVPEHLLDFAVFMGGSHYQKVNDEVAK